jgi:fibronectin type 3 domain-containing protein
MSDAKTITLTLPAPQRVVLEAGDGSITVTWDAVPRASSYNVYYSTSETPPETPVQTQSTVTTATIRGLTNDTPYYVWVASVNAGGFTLSEAKTITLTLPAPQNVVLEAGDGSITVTWDAVSLASSYHVYYSTSETPPETPVQTQSTGTTATIRGLTNDTPYYVWVASVNAGGFTLSDAKTITLTLPAPQNVVLEAEDDSVTVTWDAVPRASSYNVYYGTSQTPPETPAQIDITGTTATINGLTNDITYYVWVASVNAGGSTVSGAKSITLTLPAPRNIVLDGVNGSIAATWDAVSIASSYSVYYSASQTRPETPVKSGITGTAAAISGLTIGATYYVWVESVNSGGSTMSGALPVTLFPAWNVATSQEFTDAVASINASSEAKTYLILLTNSISAGDASFTANAEKTIRIKGEGAVRTVTNTGTAALFTVPSGITLSLENNLFLNGNAQAYRVVSVTGGTLVMNAGSRVSNARSNGIYIGNNGRFTMKGGEISANTLSGNGGGVYVDSNCTFTMEGGEISANTVSGSNGGGGVYVSGSGTFTMKGGEISGNTASSSSDGFYSYSYGGGVYVESSGTFTMKGGKISGNTASTSTSSYSYSGSYPYSFSYGGGVYVESSGTFTMEGGEISGNTASSSASSSSYYSSSSAKSYGGGVYVSSSGAFTMEGGEISGNTASSKASSSSDAYGGGVFVDGSNSTFIKRGGGTIDAANSAKYGKVAYVSSGSKQRNTAAGPNVNLDSAKSGSAGGWE